MKRVRPRVLHSDVTHLLHSSKMSSSWIFVCLYLNTGKGFSEQAATPYSGGHILHVTNRRAVCDLSHQVVQYCEISPDRTSLGCVLVVDIVGHKLRKIEG